MPDNYAHYHGYPSNITRKLGELSGYTVVSNIHLDGLNATSSEIEELESILSSNLSDKIYDTFCNSCLEIEESAFIAGFGYACKCISNGKIELGGGK